MFHVCSTPPPPRPRRLFPTVDGRNPAPLSNHGKPFPCWYLQGNRHSGVSWVVRNGFRNHPQYFQGCLGSSETVAVRQDCNDRALGGTPTATQPPPPIKTRAKPAKLGNDTGAALGTGYKTLKGSLPCTESSGTYPLEPEGLSLSLSLSDNQNHHTGRTLVSNPFGFLLLGRVSHLRDGTKLPKSLGKSNDKPKNGSNNPIVSPIGTFLVECLYGFAESSWLLYQASGVNHPVTCYSQRPGPSLLSTSKIKMETQGHAPGGSSDVPPDLPRIRLVQPTEM